MKTLSSKPRFLYHGSSIKVDILEPHKTEDWISESGRSFGVYATHNRNIAIAFALGAVPDGSGSVSRMMRSQDLNPVKMVYVKGHPNFGAKAICIS